MDRREVISQNDRGEKQAFLYEPQGSGAVLIAYLTSDVSSVQIPSAVEGRPVEAIGKSCFFDHPEIREIAFPDTLRRIGDSAFALCKGIEILRIPDSVEEIGPYAFRDCRGLRKVVLPAKLKVLRRGTFAFCNLVEPEIRLPEGLEIIETAAFYEGGLFDLFIPDSVREIQPDAFAHLGPYPLTILPHDRRWYPKWPFTEFVEDKAGEIGAVARVRRLPGQSVCAVLTICFDGRTEERFYPSGMEGLTFVTEISQRTLEEDLTSCSEAQAMYQLWKAGLI